MDFKKIENKWQKFWEEHPEIFRADDESLKPKKYVLVEFPYPSGSGLHIGHTFSFTGGDIYARFQRMKGYEVLFPMGWDAFGLPTENYAIKMKRKPQEVTKENTDMFRSQMKRLAFSFDWAREVDTTDPAYYRWTQWIFIQLFKKGLAYKKEMPINWCPSCKIGLANEEVVGGKCERCGAEVSKRNISQWVVKITDYADRLIDGLKETKFIEKVKQAQINWIDRKEWIDISYDVEGVKDKVVVATTRPDTNFGATFVVLAPEHEIVTKIINQEIGTGENLEKIKEYVIKARNKSELDRQKEVVGRDKTGVFTGLYAVNQLTHKKMPIWITDFVLSTVGTGAVVGVPGHDIRDFEFAKQFGLEIVRVVVGSDGMDIHEATKKIMDYLEEKGWGKRSTRYHLRDWIFSRQHYWGEPIPMINCPKDGWVPVPEEELPVVLPEVEAYEPTDDGQSPLSKIDSFVNCKCPVCGKDAKRETDTMPNWAGSDWYFLRYLDPHNDKSIASSELINKWMPVDVYIGGDEHNTLHLLYSRFIYKFLADIGVVPKDIPEPYVVRMSHGVILGFDNQRMSKSKGNVVVPEIVADKYGVDVMRMYLMFMGPFDGTMAWNENTLMGVKRFLDKVEKFTFDQIKNKFVNQYDNGLIINQLIEGVGKDFENFGFNTAIAKLMEAFNKLKTVNREEMKILIKLLAPLAPYMAEELWNEIGGNKDESFSVHKSLWPKTDENLLITKSVKIPVAINGKTRVVIEVDRMEVGNREKVLGQVYNNEKIKGYINGRKVIKEIMVSGKMVNLVI
ncbi:MAG: Leucine-tRNA ligase [Microgenomates group bacterium GW2011_GWA2_40_6]|nr:MAG: Leucine-tRNA ligase [Microgenomates group bacterium GW2011_GWA2_40_6]